MKDHPSQWINRGLTCRNFTDLTSEYLDGHVSALTKVRVGLHLSSCSHCRVYLKQIELVSSALGNLLKPCPPPSNRLILRQQFVSRHAN